MSNPTTPFGWQMPTATDLVTDLPADFEVFGQAVATSMADLLGGTTGQVLSKTTNADMDFTWIANDQGDITGVTAGTGISGGGTSGTVTVTNSMATAITTAGDLIKGTGAGTFDRLGIGSTGQGLSVVAGIPAWTASATSTLTTTGDMLYASAANTLARLGVGSTGQILTVAGGVPSWATPSSGIPTWHGCIIYANDISVSAGSYELLAFTGELYDSDNYHSTTTNNSRITIPTGLGGYYLIQCGGQWADATTNNTTRGLSLRVNNVEKYTDSFLATTSSTNPTWAGQQFNTIYKLAAGDYIEFRSHNNDTGNKPFYQSAGARGVTAVTLLGA
jgi:hypothetical protein